MEETPDLDIFGAILPYLKVNELPGKLVNIDTLDGGGNTTQAKLVATYLQNVCHIPTILTAEPTNGVYGQLVRDNLQGRRILPPMTLQLLFTVDRGDHLYNQLLMDGLAAGKWVVTARFSLSTLAFGISQGLFAWQLLAANVSYPWPNANFVLMTPVAECLDRLKNRGTKQELFEKKETLEKTERAYQDLSKRLPNVYLVDGTGDPPQIFERIKKIIHEKLL